MPAILAAELKPLADRFLDGLSVDQRRQAHQAMSFARGTDWLLLEEPLAALDMAHARRLMHERADLSDGGKTLSWCCTRSTMPPPGLITSWRAAPSRSSPR